jgi:hypothetical protein
VTWVGFSAQWRKKSVQQPVELVGRIEMWPMTGAFDDFVQQTRDQVVKIRTASNQGSARSTNPPGLSPRSTLPQARRSEWLWPPPCYSRRNSRTFTMCLFLLMHDQRQPRQLSIVTDR